MTELTEQERERAIKYVLVVLATPLMLHSPDYREALKLAEEHRLSAADLLRWLKSRRY